jgi:ABC-type uncharacterized transport system substrate-binding protein
MSAVNETDHKKCMPVPRPKFQAGTSQMEVRSATAVANLLCECAMKMILFISTTITYKQVMSVHWKAIPIVTPDLTRNTIFRLRVLHVAQLVKS